MNNWNIITTKKTVISGNTKIIYYVDDMDGVWLITNNNNNNNNQFNLVGVFHNNSIILHTNTKKIINKILENNKIVINK